MANSTKKSKARKTVEDYGEGTLVIHQVVTREGEIAKPPGNPLLTAGIAEIQAKSPQVKSRDELMALPPRRWPTLREIRKTRREARSRHQEHFRNATDEERKRYVEELRPAYGGFDFWPEIERYWRFGGREWAIKIPEEILRKIDLFAKKMERTRSERKWKALLREYQNAITPVILDWLRRNPQVEEVMAKHEILFDLKMPVYAAFVYGQGFTFGVYRNQILKHPPRLLGAVNPDEREDFVDSSLVKARNARRKKSLWDTKAPLIAYLYRTVSTKVIDAYRTKTRKEGPGGLVAYEDESASTDTTELKKQAYTSWAYQNRLEKAMEEVSEIADQRYPRKGHGKRFITEFLKTANLLEASKAAEITPQMGRRYIVEITRAYKKNT